jgi:threonine synthase
VHPFRCQGCGREVPAEAPAPWRCPAAGDGGDHVLASTLRAAPGAAFPSEKNPFLRYRASATSHALAVSHGLTDAAYVDLVRGLDEAIAKVDNAGFIETPFARSAALSDAAGLAAPGGVFVKDETHNVAGSHKARHLMGLALFAEVQRRAGLVSGPPARLAIASCGNAALAAGVLASAWRRALDVFIPTDANPRVVERLRALGATIHVCKREPGVPGDPCYHAFRRAVDAGALPFCCQGSDNGLTIEGGKTLAWELAGALQREGRTLDRLCIQVGGGALASATIQGLREALPSSVLPKLHPVQTCGAFPLRRAWEAVAERMAEALHLAHAPLASPQDDAALAAALHGHLASAAGKAALEESLAFAAKNRRQFMWPWETEPRSVAHGILDDETYDWLAIVRGTLESGGFPVIASEERLEEAHALGARAGYAAEHTGTAGLAGLLALCAEDLVGKTEAVAVLFSGVER